MKATNTVQLNLRIPAEWLVPLQKMAEVMSLAVEDEVTTQDIIRFMVKDKLELELGMVAGEGLTAGGGD